MAKPITISTYTNRKGEERVALQFSRDIAIQIAVGSQEGYEYLDLIRQTVQARIEAQEADRG